MVVGRERFTPRSDARGVATVVVVGLVTFGAAAAVVAVVVVALRAAGIAA